MQSKKSSFMESLLSTMIGFVVSVILTNIILPLFGFAVEFGQSIGIVLIYTIASMARVYSVRRLFNYIHNRETQRTD